MREITLPFEPNEMQTLQAGDMVQLSGTMFTARDTTHKKLVRLLQENRPLPIDLTNQLLYYCGPSPTKPCQIVGSAGPTTSSRLDSYLEILLRQGLKGTLGKGARSEATNQLFRQYQAVYFIAVGGIAALLSQTIKEAEIVAFPELGPEAMYRFRVEKFPCIVAYDCHGGDLFQTEVEKYKSILRKK